MDNYVPIRELGRGTFGVVLLARETSTGALVAIKHLGIDAANSEGQARYLAREVMNHSKLRHPHIVLFRDVFCTRTHVCIVMEYTNHGSLDDFVRREGPLDELQARFYFQQLIFALDFSHKRKVANRDIKLQNLLLHQEPGGPALLKMCDFGYSRSSDDSTARTVAGTPLYMAPEVIAAEPPIPGENPAPAYDAALADVWSCGVVLYVMLFGRYPFVLEGGSAVPLRDRMRAMRERMEAQQFVLEHPRVRISDECKVLLRGLLQFEPAERLTLEEIMTCPWFKTDLPAGAHAMNQAYLDAPLPQGPSRQRVEELIRGVMRTTYVRR